MKNHLHLSLAATALLLAAGLSCDDGGSVAGPPGGPPGGEPADTVAPATITDLALTYHPASTDVEFSWTAPRDDDATDHVARYDIRYSYSFPLDWDLSVAVTDVPAPAPEGTPQTYTLAAPLRGRDLYAAAQTYDAAGNRSAIGPVVHIHVPGIRFEAVCEDIYTRAGVEGLQALLTTNAVWNLTTGPDGRLVLDDITNGNLALRIETGTAPGPYHRFENALALDRDVTLSIPMIPVLATDSPLYANTLQIVLDAQVAVGTSRVLKRWHSYPIPWYAPAFVNGNGLDYTDLTRRAAAQWNLRTGIELFVEVDAPPAHGIELQYLPRTVMGIQNGFTEHTNDAEGYPSAETIKIVDDFSDGQKLYTIFMHELGHTIRLDHLPAGFIMFAGQPLPLDITDDEVRTVQMMLAIPNGTDLALYDDTATIP